MLRRFARALSGSQERGDRFTIATLEAVLTDASIFDRDLDPRVALFKTFSSIWVEVDGAEEDETVDALESAARQRLDAIAPEARQAFLLGALEDFGTRDIATIMGVPEAEAQGLYDAGLDNIRKQTRAKVLVIEDEPIIAMDIQSIVTGLGHDCTGIADTRDRAVALASEAPPDLILSDIQLADNSSGIDAVRDILQVHSVPVIFITAYPERFLTGERPEPAFLLTKPFKRKAVEAAISQALFFNDATLIADLPEV
jgi:CheY-like chemotaxis protein